MSEIILPGQLSGKGHGTRSLLAPDDMVYDSREATKSTGSTEEVLMKNIAAALEVEYPPPKGLPFWWGIEINESIAVLYNLALSGRDGMVIHMQQPAKDIIKKAKRFAGELLERYGVPRDYRNYSAELIIENHKQKLIWKGEK